MNPAEHTERRPDRHGGVSVVVCPDGSHACTTSAELAASLVRAVLAG